MRCLATAKASADATGRKGKRRHERDNKNRWRGKTTPQRETPFVFIFFPVAPFLFFSVFFISRTSVASH